MTASSIDGFFVQSGCSIGLLVGSPVCKPAQSRMPSITGGFFALVSSANETLDASPQRQSKANDNLEFIRCSIRHLLRLRIEFSVTSGYVRSWTCGSRL